MVKEERIALVALLVIASVLGVQAWMIGLPPEPATVAADLDKTICPVDTCGGDQCPPGAHRYCYCWTDSDHVRRCRCICYW